MIRPSTKIMLYVYLLSLVLCLMVGSVCHSYDRDAAVEYALQFSEETGDMGGNYNSTIYRKYVGESQFDCANFVSQCVIAGGIRFRAANATNVAPDGASELETGKWTREIPDTPEGRDERKYSRVITGAPLLPLSLFHVRHKGTLYKNLGSGSAVWDDVREGDTLFLPFGDHYGHCMFINRVDGNKIYVCAHSSWRRDKDLDTYGWGSDWRTDGTAHVVCLPDAPRLKQFAIFSGGTRIKWLWGKNWCTENYAKNAGRKNLDILLTFDADMRTNEIAEVKLEVGTAAYDFQPVSDSGFTNGWWTNADSDDLIHNRTWKGRILAIGLPAVKNVLGTISVRARAVDGYYNDSTNNLSKCWTAKPMKFMKIMLDTAISHSAGVGR